MAQLELDRRALFALASRTRARILRLLHPTRRTVSQIAGELGIDKAAVHRHLQTLRDAGLAERCEDHGFVYYELTWRARAVLDPEENTRIVLLLGLFTVLLTGALAAFWVVLRSIPTQWVEPASLQSRDASWPNLFAIAAPWVALGFALVAAGILVALGVRHLGSHLRAREIGLG